MPHADPEARKRYAAEWHRNNRDRRAPALRERKAKYRQEITEKIRELKHLKPCVDCSFPYPYWVMQFDHLEGKEANIADMPRRLWSWDRIQAEIDKCELVCANCHAERTFQRAHQAA